MNGKNVNLPEDSNSFQGFAVINELHQAYPDAKKKKWPWVVIALCILLLLAFLVGIPWCFEAKGKEQFPKTLSGQVQAESLAKPTPKPQKALALPQVQTLEEMTAGSMLVAAGEVIGYSQRFTLRSVDGGEAEFVEYYVRVSAFLRGHDDREVIPVRSELALASLDLGKYLLFLYEPEYNDSGFETEEGGYYRLTAGQEGAFLRDDSQSIPEYRCTEQGLDLGGTVSEMTAQIEAADERFPYDPEYYRKQALEAGAITQEEYDRQAAELESRGYAELVK